MLRKIYPLFWVLVLSLAGSLSANAVERDARVQKSNYDSYIVVMDLSPAIIYDGDVQGYEATKPRKGKKINPNSAHVRKYTKMLTAEHDELLRAAGISANKKLNDYSVAINGFSARMTHEQAMALQLNKKVIRVIPDELLQKMTHNSPSFLGLDGPAGVWHKGYDGEGVIVGVIDSGIWPEHPSFADDGTYADLGISLDDSVFSSCDFGNTAHRPDDEPFTCNNKLLGARQVLTTYRALIGAAPSEFDSARDDDGHGSHTASTSAGNANVSADILGQDFGLVTGIAPRARIIAYKGLGTLGGFGSDLAAAIDQAVADGVDVINYSVGSSSFAIGPDDIAFLFAADAGVYVATSNGNSGPGAATTGSPASVPWLTSVGASTQDRTYQGSAESSDGWEFFGASITPGTDELPLVDSADAGSELCIPGALDPTAVDGKIVLCLRGAIARIDKSEAVSIAGGAGMILYNANDGQSQVTDTHHVSSVHINNTDGLIIKDYIASSSDPVAKLNGGVFTPIDAPWMAGFSSRGPNRLSGDIIKPDVTAPGVNILAGDTPVNRGELFQMISGTSMSSPHIAGLFALIKQARPDWTPAMAKSALMTTAYQDVQKEDGATPADPFDMGAGHVDPGDKANKGSILEPGLAYDAGFLDYLGFLCEADPSQFSNPAGTCGFLDSIGVPTDASGLNLPSIGVDDVVGVRTVTRTVTSVAKEEGARQYYANVDAPPGYDVSVSPSMIKLKRGQSASYEVTITNVGAVAGQWAFGSINWSDPSGTYEVYSPMAVNGSLFLAPEAVNGNGVDGSASFDVSFGYDGAYTANPHGLVAATVTMDNVVQDPDQTFDPNDGFSNAHTITVAGAAHLRVRMPPGSVADPAIDLDLFVYDPAGNQVASSTSGGTDEAIDIPLPADGDWTVYVHGWQTAGPSADYDMYNWVISATPGGNMSIDSAPTTAVSGNTESIDISWIGAGAGEWHLGAVSHADVAGLLGLTFVEVDNR